MLSALDIFQLSNWIIYLQLVFRTTLAQLPSYLAHHTFIYTQVFVTFMLRCNDLIFDETKRDTSLLLARPLVTAPLIIIRIPTPNFVITYLRQSPPRFTFDSIQDDLPIYIVYLTFKLLIAFRYLVNRVAGFHSYINILSSCIAVRHDTFTSI